MQIVDSNDFHLRTGVFLLEKDGLEFITLPVFHIGTKEFYTEIATELDKCDLILFEGIDIKGMGVLWKSYQHLATRLGLVYQNHALNLNKHKEKLIHTDFSKEEAEREWKKVPLVSRILFMLTYPVSLFTLSYFMSRRGFSNTFKDNRNLEDGFGFMRAGKINSVQNFIRGKREQLIFNEIDKQVANTNQAPKRIGILYGAKHMEKVVLYLINQHYFKIKSSWFFTVMWL